VRVFDPNIVVRLLREMRAEFGKMHHELRDVKGRLTTIEHTLSGMASHLFAMTGTVKDHERRLRKLETRPAR
jgi:hypothetical protein